jgi:hypothetical protein
VNAMAHLRTVFLVLLLAGAKSAFAEELFYVQPLPEQTRSAEQNAEARRRLDEYSQASKLAALKEGDPDQIRIWITWANFRADTIGYETVGVKSDYWAGGLILRAAVADVSAASGFRTCKCECAGHGAVWPHFTPRC